MLRLSIIGAISIAIIILMSYIFSGGKHPDFSRGILTKDNMPMYATAFFAGILLQVIVEKLEI